MKEALMSGYRILLVFKEILDMVVVYDLLFEGVTARWRLHHLDYFREFLSLTGFERCYNFLCHGLWMLIEIT